MSAPAAIGNAEDARRILGERGERIAAEHLAGRGYRILDRNFRTRHGEVDLIASDARSLVFCEVKTRVARAPHSPFGPFASIGPGKRRRVRSMARRWLSSRQERRSFPDELRFDAIGVTISPSGEVVTVEHVEDAF
jgi:putative endonuclease